MSYLRLDHPMAVEDLELSLPPNELRCKAYTDDGRETREVGHKAMKKCKYCGSQVAWIRLGGKPAPVDAYGRLHGCLRGSAR